MKQLLRCFLWWFYMTRNKLANKWFSIKLDLLKWKYKGTEKIPGEKIDQLRRDISKNETAMFVRHVRFAAILTDISAIRPMIQHSKFYKDLCVVMFSEDLATRDDAISRVGYLFTRPCESRNAVLDEFLACLMRYGDLTESDVIYIKENLNYGIEVKDEQSDQN